MIDSEKITRLNFLKGGSLAATSLVITPFLKGCIKNESPRAPQLGGLCSPDSVYNNLESCVNIAGEEQLGFEVILNSLENSYISDFGKDKIRDIVTRTKKLLETDGKVTIFTYKDEVSEIGVPEVLASKEDENAPVLYSYFLNGWGNSAASVENSIHESAHIVLHFEIYGFGNADRTNWESQASYLGNLAAVAWCHSNGIDPSSANPDYYKADFYSITELLDSEGLHTEASQLYRYYLEHDSRYINLKIISSAKHLIETLDLSISLQNQLNDPNYEEIERLHSLKDETINLLNSVIAENEVIKETWKDVEWNERETFIKEFIDNNGFLPDDFYIFETSKHPLRSILAGIQSLSLTSETASEEILKVFGKHLVKGGFAKTFLADSKVSSSSVLI